MINNGTEILNIEERGMSEGTQGGLIFGAHRMCGGEKIDLER